MEDFFLLTAFTSYGRIRVFQLTSSLLYKCPLRYLIFFLGTTPAWHMKVARSDVDVDHLLRLRVEEERGDGEADEDERADQRHDAHADLLGDERARDDGGAGADGVAEDAAEADAAHLVDGGEDDGGELGAVAPLREEGHREAVDKDLEK